MYTSIRTLLGFGLFVGMAWHYSSFYQAPKNLDNTDVALVPWDDVAVRTPVEGLSASAPKRMMRQTVPARETSVAEITLDNKR